MDTDKPADVKLQEPRETDLIQADLAYNRYKETANQRNDAQALRLQMKDPLNGQIR